MDLIESLSLSPPPFPVSGNSSGRVKRWAGNGAGVRRIMSTAEVKEMMAVGFLIER